MVIGNPTDSDYTTSAAKWGSINFELAWLLFSPRSHRRDELTNPLRTLIPPSQPPSAYKKDGPLRPSLSKSAPRSAYQGINELLGPDPQAIRGVGIDVLAGLHAQVILEDAQLLDGNVDLVARQGLVGVREHAE
jgi:hypothetical protein